MHKIVNQFGKEIKPESTRSGRTTPPARTQSAVAVSDRYSNYPSARLTPQKLANLLRLADLGDISSQMELYEEMEEKDSHLFSVLQKRKLAITGLKFETVPFSDAETDIKIAEFVSETIRGLPDFEDNLFDICDAVAKGFSALEIDWVYEKSKHIPATLEWVQQKKFNFNNSTTPRILTETEKIKGEELLPFKFIFHIHKTRSTLPHKQGLMRTLTWVYLFKNYAVKDWVVFAEVFGIPLRVGKYDSSASEADKTALINAIRSLASDSAAVISKATEIEFIETIAKASGEGVHERLANFCDKQMSKAVLGHSAGVDSTPGKLGNETSVGEVREDILASDCEQISKTLRSQLFRPLVGFNFGFDAPLPRFKFFYEPAEDMLAKATLYKTHIENGYPVSTAHYAKEFSLPLPEKTDSVMSPTTRSGRTTHGMADAVQLKNKNGIAAFIGSDTAKQSDPADLITENTAKQGDLNPLLQPVKNLLNEVSTLAEFKEKLLDTYAGMNQTDLGNLLSQALVIAEMQGRFEVQEGN